jgi:hypothetical protein
MKLTSLLFTLSLPALGRTDSKINKSCLHASQLELNTPSIPEPFFFVYSFGMFFMEV